MNDSIYTDLLWFASIATTIAHSEHVDQLPQLAVNRVFH